MTISVIYEDQDLVVVNKPAGLVVNRAESVRGETVQGWAEKRNTNLQIYESTNENKDFVERAGIVHRLDKETSGLLLIAKTPEAFRKLQAQFKERRVKKTYLAIVHGKLVPAEGEIRAPIGRLPWNRERFGVVPAGRPAVTKYKVIKFLPPDMTLVELYPETGRTHQLRVHLKYLGYPVVGDPLYSGRKVSRTSRTWAGRVMLHAGKLTFTHPTDGRLVAFTAAIPDDMERIIKNGSV